MLDNEGHGNPEYGQIETWNCGEHGHESEQSAKDCIKEKEDTRESYFLSLNCKPVKKVEVVRKIHWSCGHPSHKHVSEYIAKKCIIDGKNKPVTSATNPGRTRKEISLICMNLCYGSTFKEEGERIGVEGSRISQIFNKAKRIIFHPDYSSANDDGSFLRDFQSIERIRKNKNAIEIFKQRLYRWECAEK